MQTVCISIKSQSNFNFKSCHVKKKSNLQKYYYSCSAVKNDYIALPSVSRDKTLKNISLLRLLAFYGSSDICKI